MQEEIKKIEVRADALYLEVVKSGKARGYFYCSVKEYPLAFPDFKMGCGTKLYTQYMSSIKVQIGRIFTLYRYCYLRIYIYIKLATGPLVKEYSGGFFLKYENGRRII